METLKSVLRGVIQKRAEVKPKSEKMLIDVAHNLEKEFISEGLENPVETVTCFGLLKIDDRFVCGPHNLWFSSCFQEVIPFLLESSEGTYGCLCYLAAIVTRELTRDKDTK